MKADENLVHYIKSHPKPVLNKGFDLFVEYGHLITIEGIEKKMYSMEVPSQNGMDIYIVNLHLVADNVEDDCDCKAFEKYGNCKHGVAAALFLLEDKFNYTTEELEELIQMEDIEEEMEFIKKIRASKTSTKKKTPQKDQSNDTGRSNPEVSPASGEWKKFTRKGFVNQGDLHVHSGYYWPTFADLRNITLTTFDEHQLHWTFSAIHGKGEVFPEIKYDAVATYYYRCTCKESTGIRMCRHVRLAFDKLIGENGSSYFLKFRDWTKEKGELLKPYGLTLADEEAKSFKFSVSYLGDLQVEAPPAFIRMGDGNQFKRLNRLFKPGTSGDIEEILRPKPGSDTVIDFEVGFLMNMNSQRLKLGFELETVKVFARANRSDVKKLSINQPANYPLLNELSNEAYRLVLQLSDTQLLEWLKAQGQGYIGNYSNPWQQMAETTFALLKKRYMEGVQKLWPHMTEYFKTFLLRDGKFSTNNCKPVSLGSNDIELSFKVIADDRFITLQLIPLYNGNEIMEGFELFHGFFFYYNNTLSILKNLEDSPVVEQFSKGFIKIPAASKHDVLQSIIAPLQERFQVQLPEAFKIKTIHIKPVPQVLLKEFNSQYLMVQAQFLYEGLEVDYSNNPEDIVSSDPDGSQQVIKRDVGSEKQFFEMLRALHHTFDRQRQNDFFYVHFNEVMKGNWFLNTVRYLHENNFTVKGMQELKYFRYNTNKPKWEMKAGSGIDWFDLQVKVSFGDQQVALKDIRKAVLNKQNIVVLGDGTFGVLPEEWLEQYGMLLKMGDEQKGGSLRLSKLHFTVLDELQQEIDDNSVLQEIETKKQKLKDIEAIKTNEISKSIQAMLRPYQVSGFQWLQTLDELGWGGCLADDMGLGKTLQVISFLQLMKEKYKGSTHLVVCPTSLIYNWEMELEKFAPDLRYHIYYGSGREFTDEHFESYDIVITSYALVRIDIEQLLQFKWHYVILDESQAIKNPDAQTTKAVQLLKSRNRLILSGTPVQNNTFDLFSQFNFINAGLLGNKEFYKTEFANPIDKYNDAEKSRQLRKLIYPFLLRRTKEEVAKDLPDKTEIILWCQLQKEQRGVYEDYKNYYRTMLMKKIEEEGMSKAGMHVLEGLLRLRQICDSPELLKDPEINTAQSVKAEELLREIEENTGNHKLLVFSQFTEMLHLIKLALEKKNVLHCYLDGSTSADKRKQQVDAFQNDASIKVFLVSLKAGGVGLNLTAADYVYIVDPWWNPAVEQQAIDRTHRIGQTKKVFAYKMICKDTVEEKIIQLQQRKKQIANDLVTEDAGFIKKLKKEDVEFLFS
jgi:hypothetical protein